VIRSFRTLTPMVWYGLRWTLAASMNYYSLIWSFLKYISNKFLWTPLTYPLRLVKLLFLTLWLSWTHPASSTFWLELVSTHFRTLTPMNFYGLLWSFLKGWVSDSFSNSYSYGVLWTPLNSCSIIQLLKTELSLCLLILELWLPWTHMDSFGPFSQARLATLSQTMTHMDSDELLQPLTRSSKNFDTNELLRTPFVFSSKLGHILLLLYDDNSCSHWFSFLNITTN
jgi:hypothetical protein